MSHTQGLWSHEFRIDKSYCSKTGILIEQRLDTVGTKEGSLAVIMDHSITKEEAIANARIMAAAPEMLEALENLLLELQEHEIYAPVRMNPAMAIIKKMKGE